MRNRNTKVFLLVLAWFCGVTLSSCSTDVSKGAKLATEGKWDDAIAAYREAVKKNPLDRDLQLELDAVKTRAATQYYVDGRQHQLEGRLDNAVASYKRALGLDPSRVEHHAALQDVLRLQDAQQRVTLAHKLHQLGRLDEALEAYESAIHLEPALHEALQGITTIAHQQRRDKALGGSTQPITLRFQNAKLKEVFDALARAGGIDVLFDRDVRDEPITIFIKETPFDEALTMILNINGLFAQRIGPNTLLVMPNTKAKQDQYQDLMIRTFYLSNSKAKEMVTLIRTVLDTKRVYVNEQINALVIRETPAKLQLAERVLLANDRRDAEVELDVEVLEVNRTKSQKYGINFAKSAGGAVTPPGFTGGISTDPIGFSFQQLTSISPQSYLFSIPASVILDFFKTESDAKTLASPKLRVLNGKQASVNVGEKQPVLLSTTNVLPGQSATGAVPTTSTVTSVEFKDTGVKLTVEPLIHLTNDVTLKLKIEVTRLEDQVTLQASPEIKQFRFGTRTAETVLNIKNDEAVVLAGLIQDDDRKSRVTVPGLGDIPILGKLFSSNTEDITQTEVMLTITPHIIRSLSAPHLEAQAFWSGTENAYATVPLFTPAPGRHEKEVVDVTDLSGKPASDTHLSTSHGASSEHPLARDVIHQLQASPALRLEQASEVPSHADQSCVQVYTKNFVSAQSDQTIQYDSQRLHFLVGTAHASDLSLTSAPGTVTLHFPATLESPARGPLALLCFESTTPSEMAIHSNVGLHATMDDASRSVRPLLLKVE